jgi:hypothetical protein
MKRSLSLVLALAMMVAVFSATGCKPAQGPVKLGLGSVTSIASSKDAAEGVTAVAQADTTIVAVALDKDGKILDVRIDTAQTKVNFNAEMAITNDKSAAIKTKQELGFDYNMKNSSAIGKEWFEQIAAFEEWMKGKTVDEVKGLKVKEQGGHTDVPDIPELTSSVTITVKDYIAALVKAAANTVEVQNFNSLGLGAVVSIASSKDATDTTTALAQIDTNMAATAFDKDGKVLGVILDVVQAKVPYDAEGKITADKTKMPETKKELKEGYNMKGSSAIGKEWYEQAASFEEWMKGKKISEITGLKLTDKAEPDIPELTSSVTITVDTLIAAVKKSSDNKR